MYPSHTQYRTMLTAKLQSWLRRQSRRLPEAWREATLVLLRLDLDPARPLLRALYSSWSARTPSLRRRLCAPGLPAHAAPLQKSATVGP